MTTPLVSVLVPAYNDARFLRQALESLCAQSFPSFEAVVSDDASKDDTRSVADSFAQRDPRFRVVANAQNVGMTRNWNRALQAARGRYVVKLDADDAFRPETLEHLAAAMEGAPQAMSVFCRTTTCDVDLREKSSYLGEQALLRAGIDPAQPSCRSGHEWYRLCFDDFQLWHSNAGMHRRETLLAMGGWDESWGCAADTDLILRVLERNERVCHVPYAGVLYRLRPGSISDQYRRQAWLAWESALIHHDSLARYASGGGALSTPLRKAWWRYWSHWTALRSSGENALSSLRHDAKQRLIERAARVRPPPWPLRAEGYIRQHAWNFLRG